MKPDFKAIQEDKEISLLIEKGNEVLKALGYTEHSRRHAAKVSQTAGEILEKLGYKDKHRTGQNRRLYARHRKQCKSA